MRLLCAAVAALALSTACGWTRADEQLLVKFFERSRAYDRTLLAPVATVVFDPRTDGVVERFDIVARGAERRLDDGRLTKDVTVDAAVRSAAGRLNQRTLTVTLEQRDGAWMVTRVR